MISIRFVTGNDPVSAAIRAGEYGFWASHAEAVMPDGSLLGAHYDGGVQDRPAGYDKGTVLRETIVDLVVPPAAEAAFYAFLKAQLGKPYDLEAIAGLLLERDWREDDSWFCSELVTAALEKALFILPLAADVAKVTPRDLLLILSSRVPVGA